MGEVYRARDTRLGRDVALKIIHSEVAGDPDLRARFEREARTVAKLNHPNIVALYEVGNADGIEYTVSELVDGEALRARRRPGGMRVRDVVELATQIADGMAAAHAVGIVHRDLKPENVMVTRDGRVKILDFGFGMNTGGESGIRTHVRVSPKHAFQACAFSHSAISPASIPWRKQRLQNRSSRRKAAIPCGFPPFNSMGEVVEPQLRPDWAPHANLADSNEDVNPSISRNLCRHAEDIHDTF